MISSGRKLPFRVRTADWIVLCVVFAVCVFSFVFLHVRGGEEGKRVEVLQDGQLVYAASLDRDNILTLEGNRVVVEGRGVHMDWADCPDQVCAHTGRITRPNQMIVCLPNRVIIKISAREEQMEIDSVAR